MSIPTPVQFNMEGTPTHFDASPDASPWLFGTGVAGITFGMVILQALIYFCAYVNDGAGLKLLVASMLVLCCVDWGVSMFCNYQMLVGSASSPWSLIIAPIEAIVPLLTMVLAATLSQGYYGLRAYRIWGKRIAFAIPSIVLIAASFAIGMAMVINLAVGPMIVLNLGDLVNFDAPNKDQVWWRAMHLLQAFLGVSALSDVVQTVSLLLGIAKQRWDGGSYQKGFNPTTDSLILRIALMVLTAGMLSTTVAVADCLLILLSAHEGPAHVGMCISLTPIYALTLLATLNLRKVINPATGSSAGNSGSRGTSKRGSGRTWQVGMPLGKKMSASQVSDTPTFVHVKTDIQTETEDRDPWDAPYKA